MRSARTDTGMTIVFGVLTLIALLMMAAAAVILLRQGMESAEPTPEALISDGTFTPLPAATRTTSGATAVTEQATAEETDAPPTETLRPTPTQFIPVVTPGSGGGRPSTTPGSNPTQAAATVPPATTAPDSTAASPATTETVSINLIALGNNGEAGSPAGCGDSLIAVQRTIPAQESTPARVTAALNALFAIMDETIDGGALYNALHQSLLLVDGVTMEGDTAVVALSGTINPGDDCDKSRIEAQIETTIGQVWQVQSVRVTVNGVPLEDVLYGGG